MNSARHTSCSSDGPGLARRVQLSSEECPNRSLSLCGDVLEQVSPVGIVQSHRVRYVRGCAVEGVGFMEMIAAYSPMHQYACRASQMIMK